MNIVKCEMFFIIFTLFFFNGFVYKYPLFLTQAKLQPLKVLSDLCFHFIHLTCFDECMNYSGCAWLLVRVFNPM